MSAGEGVSPTIAPGEGVTAGDIELVFDDAGHMAEGAVGLEGAEHEPLVTNEVDIDIHGFGEDVDADVVVPSAATSERKRTGSMAAAKLMPVLGGLMLGSRYSDRRASGGQHQREVRQTHRAGLRSARNSSRNLGAGPPASGGRQTRRSKPPGS